MSVTLHKDEETRELGDHIFEIYEMYYDPEEDGFNDLEDLYAMGMPEDPADKVLSFLVSEKYIGVYLAHSPEDANVTFTSAEIEYLNEQNSAVQKSETYPENIKKGYSKLLKKINKEAAKPIARREGRNLLHGKLGGILNPSGRSNTPAIHSAIGMPGFAAHLGSFLSGTPRINRESEGRVNAALKNLAAISRGDDPEPLLPRGTGTRNKPYQGGRRMRKTRKSRARKAKLKFQN